MRDTKPNLNNNLFEQFIGDTLSLSGDTDIYGEMDIKSGATLYVREGIEDNLTKFEAGGKVSDSGISSETVVFDLTDFIQISGTTANTDTVIPAKFRIVSIVFNETSGNAVGDISVGITSGGTDIINADTVGASALVDGAIGTSIFSTTSSQIIYITSSTWGSGVVDTYIRMEKFIE